jgi:protease-4
VVASGRKLSRDDVDRLAQGRVYTGAHAHEAKLVDVLGGFDVALRELRARVPESVRDRAEPVLARAPRRPLPVLAPPASASALLGALATLLPRAVRDVVALAAQGERVLLLWTGEAGGSR